VNGINASGDVCGTYQDAAGGFHAYFWGSNDNAPITITVPGQIRSVCGSVNDHGEVVGTYRTPDGSGFDRFGFLLSKGEFTKIDDPNSQPFKGGTEINGINDPGDIVGFYFDDNNDIHGFVLSDGVYTTLDVPGATLTIGQGISNPGEIAGQYNDASGNGHGFVLSGGVYTTVDVPGANEFQGGTAVYSVNPQGHIVGTYWDADGNQHGFIGTPAP
jgi:uncharacterized membrane protein